MVELPHLYLEKRVSNGWFVQMKGPPADLSRAAEWLEQLGYSISIEGGDHMVQGHAFAVLNDPRKIRDSVKDLLEKVNRAARQRHTEDYAGVQVGRVIRRERQGTTHHVLVADTVHFTVSIDAVVVSGDSITRRDPAPVPEMISIIEHNSDLQKALDYFQANPTWPGYFMAFEVVEKALGGRQQIWARGWATKADVTRFTMSAQQGRHHEPGAVHPQPFSEHDGGRFIRALLDRWIEEERGKVG